MKRFDRSLCKWIDLEDPWSYKYLHRGLEPLKSLHRTSLLNPMNLQPDLLTFNSTTAYSRFLSQNIVRFHYYCSCGPVSKPNLHLFFIIFRIRLQPILQATKHSSLSKNPKPQNAKKTTTDSEPGRSQTQKGTPRDPFSRRTPIDP